MAMKIRGRIFLSTLLIMCMTAVSSAQELRDGKLFDSGVTMTKRAEGVSPELDKVSFMIGQWDVSTTNYKQDGSSTTTNGNASITYMNKGHALMMRYHTANYEGTGESMSMMAFLVYNAAQKQWQFGRTDSRAKAIYAYNGGFEGDSLVVSTARRLGGGPLIWNLKSTFGKIDSDSFEHISERSNNRDSKWLKTGVSTFKRRQPTDDFMTTRDDYGLPAPGTPAEERQFDFLIGEYTASHVMFRPNNQNIVFSSPTTAVYCLDGHAILEFWAFGGDPNLPDYSTSLIRVYNEAMRRWECIFLTNRFNNLYYFGGHKEGDTIILTGFGADVASGVMSQYIFYDIEENSYLWKGINSRDRGKTWTPGWTIDCKRIEGTAAGTETQSQ